MWGERVPLGLSPISEGGLEGHVTEQGGGVNVMGRRQCECDGEEVVGVGRDWSPCNSKGMIPVPLCLTCDCLSQKWHSSLQCKQCVSMCKM